MVGHVLQSMLTHHGPGRGQAWDYVYRVFLTCLLALQEVCEECNNKRTLVQRESELRSNASLLTAYDSARADVDDICILLCHLRVCMSHVDSAGVL